MSVWTNKTTTGGTNWSVDDDGNITQEWSHSNTSASSLGTATPAGSAIGTYDSAATAATSLLGSKYHLFDDKEFHFGTDSDVRISFDTAGAGMMIRVLPAQDDNSTLMTLRNGDVDVVRFLPSYLTLSVSETSPNEFSSAEEGSFMYYSGDLYLRSDS